jgi:5-methylcytosine-specific restriction endonuclease McrA
MSKSYSAKLRDPRWQKKRLDILNRDNFTCRLCRSTIDELHVHHLRYRKSAAGPWDYPDDDLLTLCLDCHDLAHKMSGRQKFKIFHCVMEQIEYWKRQKNVVTRAVGTALFAKMREEIGK